jgi:membrane protein DedA with SNARE-associated domain
MKRVLIGVVLLGIIAGSTSCVAPLALGAAVVGAGAGAQAGWWFGKSSKQASDKPASEAKEKKEVTHAGSESR